MSIPCAMKVREELKKHGWSMTYEEGLLLLLELLCKANAGYYNSHTEEGFLSEFLMLNKDRTANKEGRRFICKMIYTGSNKKPLVYDALTRFRN